MEQGGKGAKGEGELKTNSDIDEDGHHACDECPECGIEEFATKAGADRFP